MLYQLNYLKSELTLNSIFMTYEYRWCYTQYTKKPWTAELMKSFPGYDIN